MRFLIIGAGALGGYYGGMLLKGGADVTFLVRPRRAAQLAERGLVIREPGDVFTTPVKTVQAGTVGGPYDVVFLACKAYDLDSAIDEFAPALAPDGAVLPVLNGINHIEILSDRLGVGFVLGGVTRFSVVRNADGEIDRPGVGAMQTSFGELTGDRSRRCEEIHAAFTAGGVPCMLSDSIVAEMWGKFSGFAGATAVAVLTRGRAGEIARAPAGADFAAAALDEADRVTSAAGYPMPAAIKNMYIGVMKQPDSVAAPSMLYDIENGRPTEFEHIFGDLVRRADQLGVDAPILRAALCSLQIYEARLRSRNA
jgi:2-dehydropantoate 2-reductase